MSHMVRRLQRPARASTAFDCPIVASRLNCSAVATSPSRTMPSLGLRHVLGDGILDKPVPNAILRWLSPACRRMISLFPFWKPPGSSIPKCGNDLDVAPKVA